jgi:diguanylate cyclase (GGDEF)-like protein/PAS domain S-box-containing protein
MSNRVLIITADAGDINTLREALGQAHDGPFLIEAVTSLAHGIARLRQGDIDVVLVDLALPDSQGIATFDRLFAAAPQTPIMTLSAPDDEALSIQAVQHGSQGYFSKGHFSGHLVSQSLRNIIQRKAVEAKLYGEKIRAEITLNSISDAVIATDLRGNIDYLNAAAEKLTGWRREEAQGLPIDTVMQLINFRTHEHGRNPIEWVLQDDEPMGMTCDTVLIKRDGSQIQVEDSAAPIHDSNGRIKGAVIVFHDVTAAHAMTLKMTHLAQHDFLTNLPNRVLLEDRIAQAILLAQRNGTKLALFFLDLDNFKLINDSLGHEVGDMLLKSVAARLCNCVRSSDTVSRQGGDEFVLLLAEGMHAENAALTADKIIAVLAAPHAIAQHELHITPSIGISVYPTDANDATTLMKNADTAMYHAKEKGRNNYQFFKDEMNTQAVERQLIEGGLRHALARSEFILHYQPLVNLANGKITGAEALLRWIHPEWGLIMPERFVGIAEDCGLIVPIGLWVLREACEQAMRWKSAGLNLGLIAVNVSALEFLHSGFVETVRKILDDTGLAPVELQLEITERVLMRDAASSAAVLQLLKKMGVQLAVDDFGTGYSSLSYLTQFPIDVLKIDQSFMHEIESSSSNGIVVSAVIAMGNSLKQRVVAEGIEKLGQLAFLMDRQCEEGQGYIFSRPLPPFQFAALLAS